MKLLHFRKPLFGLIHVFLLLLFVSCGKKDAFDKTILTGIETIEFIPADDAIVLINETSTFPAQYLGSSNSYVYYEKVADSREIYQYDIQKKATNLLFENLDYTSLKITDSGFIVFDLSNSFLLFDSSGQLVHAISKELLNSKINDIDYSFEIERICLADEQMIVGILRPMNSNASLILCKYNFINSEAEYIDEIETISQSNDSILFTKRTEKNKVYITSINSFYSELIQTSSFASAEAKEENMFLLENNLFYVSVVDGQADNLLYRTNLSDKKTTVVLANTSDTIINGTKVQFGRNKPKRKGIFISAEKFLYSKNNEICEDILGEYVVYYDEKNQLCISLFTYKT